MKYQQTADGIGFNFLDSFHDLLLSSSVYLSCIEKGTKVGRKGQIILPLHQPEAKKLRRRIRSRLNCPLTPLLNDKATKFDQTIVILMLGNESLKETIGWVLRTMEQIHTGSDSGTPVKKDQIIRGIMIKDKALTCYETSLAKSRQSRWDQLKLAAATAVPDNSGDPDAYKNAQLAAINAVPQPALAEDDFTAGVSGLLKQALVA